VIVMVARVYTGLHWPTDVLGGLAVGILAGRAIWLLAKPLYIFTRFGVWLTRRQIK
jgi:undecaprenyl-diphosphatase